MNYEFSKRIEDVPPSFLREMFRIIADTRIISFAAGSPNPSLFPVEAFRKAAEDTLTENPQAALQYGATDGLPELREIIAHSYKEKDNIIINPNEVLITNGSQQGLDLIGKVLINEGDSVAVENPTYLAAIQALSLYQPTFVAVPLLSHGIDTNILQHIVDTHHPKILYTIPNFQNPTGLTYDESTRKKTVEILEGTRTLLIEDDPYGEIRFEGERQAPFATYTDNAVLLGSFSKIVAPGFRLGWIVTKDKDLYKRLEIAKQASDLHTSMFIQNIVYRYYRDNDAQAHILKIATAYKKQKDAMIAALQSNFGDTVTYTDPEGGMFIWVTFPDSVDTAKLFALAIEEGVAFVPGESFFSVDAPKNTMRLNYSNSTFEQIDEGMKRLRRAFEKYSA